MQTFLFEVKNLLFKVKKKLRYKRGKDKQSKKEELNEKKLQTWLNTFFTNV